MKIKIFFILIILSLSIASYADFAFGNGAFVNTWKIIGPFSERIGFNNNMIGEESIEPKVGDTVKGLTWEYLDDRLFSRNYDDYVDVFSYYNINKKISTDGVIVYCHNYVYSEKEQSVQVRFSGDRYSKVFINGKNIIASRVGFPGQRDRFVNSTGGFQPDNWMFLQDNAQKDALKETVTLKKGWNSVLVKIGNERDSVLGFYFRICDESGNKIPNIFYSINGPKAKKFEIDNSNNMPQGYRAWPYVGFHQSQDFMDYAKSMQDVAIRSTCSSEDFTFTVSGGVPSYRWSIKGNLPKGLKFNNGSIVGTIDSKAELKDYNFTLICKDKNNNIATKDFTINVKERPNKWIEETRMDALLHTPETLDFTKLSQVVSLMEAQNYALVMPINFNNGLYNFRSKNRYNTVPEKDLGDAFTPLKEAFKNSSVKFGTYNGNLPLAPQFTYEQVVPMYYDLMKNCEPKAIWSDWLGVCHGSVDAIYSMIKSINPEIVIFSNGVERFINGDWDIISLEYFSDQASKYGTIWDRFVYNFGRNNYPFVYNWPKAYSMETWHSIADEETVQKFPQTDWNGYLKLNIAIISEGGISNLDHTISEWTMKQHKKMADWANPKGLEPLYNAYTNCYPYDINNDFGYVNVDLKGENLYVITMETPLGKTGLKGEKISFKFNGDVKNVTYMNSGESINWICENNKLVLDTSNISQDKVCNIFKVSLNKPVKYSSEPRKFTKSVYTKKKGNLAYHKTGRYLTNNFKPWYQSSGYNRHPFYAIDGNMDTDTAPGDHYSWAYWLDLENEFDISKIDIYMGGKTTNYQIDISLDNKEWTPLVKGENNELNDELHLKFNKVKTRYIRILSIKPNGGGQPGGQFSIKEIEVYK